MRESDAHRFVFDAGREAGRLEEAKKILLELAEYHFGEPEDAYLTFINSFTDLRDVEQMILEIDKVWTGWLGLFARVGYACTIDGRFIR